VCVVPDELSCETLAVRVNQKLVRIEAVACFRRVGTMHTIAIKLARGRVREIDVPHIVGTLRHGDAFGLALPFAIE
jgi:hypothetical protein